MLVYGLKLNQDVFELCLVQLMNCLKDKKEWIPGIFFFFFFFEKTTSFACLVRSGLNDIFQLKALSRIFTKSLFGLNAEILALFTTEKGEVSLTLAVRPKGRSLM